MDMDNSTVRSWKEYTPAGVSDSNPVRPIDLADTTFGGMIAESWWGVRTYFCCEGTTEAACTI